MVEEKDFSMVFPNIEQNLKEMFHFSMGGSNHFDLNWKNMWKIRTLCAKSSV